MSLEPLSERAMDALLTGFVPGLPESLRERILARAEGVPLYAVETIRMLLDQGLLEQHGNEYRPTGPIEALEVPETLHALIAARLDGLAPEERRLVQDASVLGKTFTKQALADVGGVSEEELEPLLSALMRKEVFSLQADPRSPERGQYGFLQDLLRRVAYETLAEAGAKGPSSGGRPLSRARVGAGRAGDRRGRLVPLPRGVQASRPRPTTPPRSRERRERCSALAGERAASLAANDEALRYFEQAADLADDPFAEAELWELAGQAAWSAGELSVSEDHLQRAESLFEAQGATHPAARVSVRLGEVEWRAGRLTEALDRLEAAFAALSADEPDADVAALAAQLGRFHFFAGDLERASDRIETALSLSESLWLPEVLSQSLNTAGLIAAGRGKPEQALALLKHALELALENDLPQAVFRGHHNLADQLGRRDRYEEALEQQRRGLAVARRLGDRTRESLALSELSWGLYMTGRWTDALAAVGEIPEEQRGYGNTLGATVTLVDIYVHTGQLDEARRCLERAERWRTSVDVQERSGYAEMSATLFHAEGRHEEALAAAEEAMQAGRAIGPVTSLQIAFDLAIEASLRLSRLDNAEELIAAYRGASAGGAVALPPGRGGSLARASGRGEGRS